MKKPHLLSHHTVDVRELPQLSRMAIETSDPDAFAAIVDAGTNRLGKEIRDVMILAHKMLPKGEHDTFVSATASIIASALMRNYADPHNMAPEILREMIVESVAQSLEIKIQVLE